VSVRVIRALTDRIARNESARRTVINTEDVRPPTDVYVIKDGRDRIVHSADVDMVVIIMVIVIPDWVIVYVSPASVVKHVRRHH